MHREETHFLCQWDVFNLFRVIPFGALTMRTPLFSMPRCKGSSPRAISPRCFALPPSGSELGTRSIPRVSASTSARSSDLSMLVRKLKSLSNAAGVANSFLLRYSAGSRTPEHCDHSLWRLEQASEHVRLAHRGHLYFCLFSWLLSHHSISFVPDPLPFLHVTDSLTAPSAGWVKNRRTKLRTAA